MAQSAPSQCTVSGSQCTVGGTVTIESSTEIHLEQSSPFFTQWDPACAGQAWSGSVACNGQCVKSGNRCSGGDTPSILRACCEDTDVCVHGFDDDKDEAFSACVPRDDPGPGDPAECSAPLPSTA